MQEEITGFERRPLQVGDAVYLREMDSWNRDIHRYRFATVERLTKTRAVLSNKVVLINEPKFYTNWDKKESVTQFYEYGNTRIRYEFTTPKVIEEAKKAKEIENSINFFFNINKLPLDKKVKLYQYYLTLKTECDTLETPSV